MLRRLRCGAARVGLACHKETTAPSSPPPPLPPPSGPQPVLVATVPIAPNYGIHDTFVRDGLVFVFAWRSGVMIFDVGKGIQGGSPSSPVLVGQVVTDSSNINGGPALHNGWW